jgi:hypothetical protein
LRIFSQGFLVAFVFYHGKNLLDNANKYGFGFFSKRFAA